jgi:hypothetical protein
MFISGNDNDYSYMSPIPAVTDKIGPMEQLLFPFMNFTCSGNITKLIFVARRENNQRSVISWPVFSLWHNMSGDFMLRRRLGADYIPPAYSRDLEEVFMVNFRPPIQFEPDYILGLRQYSWSTSSSSFSGSFTQPNGYNNIMKVLRHTGGYGLTLVCNQTILNGRCPAMAVTEHREMPYIAVETSK